MKNVLLKQFLITAASVLAAGASWMVALVIFIPIMKTGLLVFWVIVWLLSPVVVSLGFAFGYWLAARWLRGSRDRFARLWLWPLVGCSIGAAAAFWFGPMLIVVGAFAGGMASLILREAAQIRHSSTDGGVDDSASADHSGN
jgi:hypothetical protein